MKYLVSACLAGEPCRYNGSHCGQELFRKMVEKGEAVPVCPEVLGGLPVPREPSEIREGRVFSCSGEDLTDKFETGARLAAELAEKEGAVCAILKENSPSCGFGRIYDGSFSGKLINGSGISADQLNKQGLFLFNERNFSGSQGVVLKKVREKDFSELVEISRESFLIDSTRYSPCGPGGPEGFDSIPWHKDASKRGKFFVFFKDEEMAGGVFISLKSDHTGWVNRIFVKHALRGRGIGRRVFFLLEQKYSRIMEWGLDTPDWAKHNQRFYESMGYRRCREIYFKEAGFNLVVLKKKRF